MCGEGGSWVGVCVPLALSLSFENSEITVLLHKEFEILTLHSKFFETLKFVFLSEVVHMSFCTNFSVL